MHNHVRWGITLTAKEKGMEQERAKTTLNCKGKCCTKKCSVTKQSKLQWNEGTCKQEEGI